MLNKNAIFLAPALALTLAACASEEPVLQGEAAQPAAEAVVKAEKAGAAPKAAAGYVKGESYFKVPAVNGGDLDLAAYAGKPVMFMLFTETCPFCRKAAPAVENLHKAYGAKGLAVLGLCIQDSPEPPANFARDLGVTFPMGYGAREVYRQYRAQGVPYIYLLDKKHEPAAVWPGYDQSFDAQMKQAVEKALAEK